MLRNNLICTLVCLLEKKFFQDFWTSSISSPHADQAAYGSEIPDQYPKSPNVIKKYFQWQKYNIPLKPEYDSITKIQLNSQPKSPFLCFWFSSSKKPALLWLALLVLFLPRTHQKKGGTRQKPHKAKAKRHYGTLNLQLGSQIWEEQTAKWSPCTFLPDRTEGTEGDSATSAPPSSRWHKQRPLLKWKEVHSHDSDTPWAPQRLIAQGELPSALNFHFVFKSKNNGHHWPRESLSEQNFN